MEKEKTYFKNFFKNLKLSRQKEREFSEWIPEIAYAYKISEEQVLENSELVEIKNDLKMNGPQKLSKIRNVLYRMRYPQLSRIKNEWLDLINKINPSKKRVQFNNDPYFEKPFVEIKITAESVVEVQNLLRQLNNINEYDWDKIIDPFKGKF